MFATLLLRILQTIPGDVKYDVCGSSEEDTTMKENMNKTLFDCDFGRKETDPLHFEETGNYESRNGPRNSMGNDVVKEPFCPSSCKDADSSPPDSIENPTTAEDSPSFDENRVKDSILTKPETSTDKNVLENGVPRLIVCDKEIVLHVVKDVFMDEGPPLNGIKSIKINENEPAGQFYPRPLNECSPLESTQEATDVQIFVSDDSACSSLGMAESSLESSSDGELMPKVETSCVESDETVSDCSAGQDSYVYQELPIHEFGTRSFLRSFISSLDLKGNNETERCLQDQKIILKEDVQASALSYNSKVESKTITFDFDPPLYETAGVSNDKPENAMIQSFDSTNVHGRKNSDSYSSIQETSIEEGCTESLKFENGFLAFSEAENGHDQLLSDFKDGDSFKVNGNESVVDREKYEHDESSFSDFGFVSHSGPIPFPGSISFRSDGSGTSGRSFAFPILQSEWTSSPVRMAKADGRHLRKHKFWRSGLLCCRF